MNVEKNIENIFPTEVAEKFSKLVKDRYEISGVRNFLKIIRRFLRERIFVNI